MYVLGSKLMIVSASGLHRWAIPNPKHCVLNVIWNLKFIMQQGQCNMLIIGETEQSRRWITQRLLSTQCLVNQKLLYTWILSTEDMLTPLRGRNFHLQSWELSVRPQLTLPTVHSLSLGRDVSLFTILLHSYLLSLWVNQEWKRKDNTPENAQPRVNMWLRADEHAPWAYTLLSGEDMISCGPFQQPRCHDKAAGNRLFLWYIEMSPRKE